MDKVKAFAVGGVDYLTKPFQMEELHARVETHLKLRRLQLELEEYSRDLELARERLKLDLELAREVQRDFLPLFLPDVSGYEFFAHYESAYEVGGDYYDFIPLTGQRVAVLLGDVAGKGVVAALLMAKLSADARFCMLTEPDPAAAITKLNALMIKSGLADRFVTLVAAVLDPVRHTVTLVNAGHPSPLIYHRGTRTAGEAISTEVAGLPLGVLDGFEYTSCQVHLEPGDSILAFTDGVTEATDVQDLQLQMKGVYAAVRGGAYSPKALGEQVVKVVKQFAAGRSQQDDIALVGFGRTGAS
ncbi:SpoIIE family protein phosphatase [Gemmata sp. G18]|uniref:SpoIIE family protein phosphatase n=2 Tax=Gemmata palustris TaxID=2822762 RepID=A0ABS5BTJ0_9BACT|nr:SpoIIE family protein phosphatase [Gemmata palustris]